jgi:hypothetical protein
LKIEEEAWEQKKVTAGFVLQVGHGEQIEGLWGNHREWLYDC